MFQIIQCCMYIYKNNWIFLMKKNLNNPIYSTWRKTCSLTILNRLVLNRLSEKRNTLVELIIIKLLQIFSMFSNFLAMFYSAIKLILGPLKNTISLLWILVTIIYSIALNVIWLKSLGYSLMSNTGYNLTRIVFFFKFGWLKNVKNYYIVFQNETKLQNAHVVKPVWMWKYFILVKQA